MLKISNEGRKELLVRGERTAHPKWGEKFQKEGHSGKRNRTASGW